MDQQKKNIPTLYDWAGGINAINQLMALFYKNVSADELLGPVFKHMSPEHQQHVAQFIAEVFGGPKYYTEAGGTHFKMIQKHLSKHLTEQHRKRWVELLVNAADELNFPADPEFRSAFVAYLEWGTRIAVLNSNTDNIKLNPAEPMPKWGWGEPGGPFEA